MKTLRLFGVVLMTVIFAAVILGAAPPLTVANPDTAPFIDNAYHVIQPYSTLWYRLNYEGDHSQMNLRLVKGNENALQFMVHKPAQMSGWWKNPDPVGQGSPQKDDLVWSGNSHEGGTWYVEVMNYNDKPVVFNFEAQGKGILPASAPVSAPPVIAAAAVPQPTFGNTAPETALPISGEKFVIPANTTLWYSFFYPGDHTQVVVRLDQGAKEKLNFMIHAPNQLSKWWDVDPIGRGSPEGDDLVWSSNSHEGGTYMVEVANHNPYAVGFTMSAK